MTFGKIFALCMLASVCNGITNFPRNHGKECGLTYESVMPKPNWICDQSEYVEPYPMNAVQACLNNDTYWEVNEYLNVVKNCYAYVDDTALKGENEYYTYESVCKLNRRPVHMIWASVPGYTPTSTQAVWRNGLLPVHVLQGQSLFDAECVHPWSDGMPHQTGRRGSRRGSRRGGRRGGRRSRPNLYAAGPLRHACLIGYGYKKELVCKPTGFITREVIVYSPHANKIFSVVVPDVPTSCACSYCACGNKGIPSG